MCYQNEKGIRTQKRMKHLIPILSAAKINTVVVMAANKRTRRGKLLTLRSLMLKSGQNENRKTVLKVSIFDNPLKTILKISIFENLPILLKP